MGFPPSFRPRQLATRSTPARFTTALGISLALNACGGAPGAGVPAASDAFLVGNVAAVAQAPGHAPRTADGDSQKPSSQVADTSGPQPVAAGTYALVILDKNVVHRDGDELAPSHGAGYRTLHAFVYLGGQPRSRSPVAGVKPYCETSSKCEYLPARKSGRPDKYTITLDDDSVATLSASEDLVTIRARQLALQRPLKVTVTLTMPGQQAVTRQIIYAKAKG